MMKVMTVIQQGLSYVNETSYHLQVACLITECVNTAAGLVVPPKGFLPKVCQLIHEEGGLVIMDEVLVSRGRGLRIAG